MKRSLGEQCSSDRLEQHRPGGGGGAATPAVVDSAAAAASFSLVFCYYWLCLP